ncbi:MAG: alpha/beta fold hydrolase [Bacteroidota bacterium]
MQAFLLTRILRLTLMAAVVLVIAGAGSEPDFSEMTVKEYRAHLKTVAVDGGNMAYLDLGKGQPILLVHGVPTSSWLYRHVASRLTQQGFRVIAPDLLGYGNSDKPKDVDQYDTEKQAQRLIALMDTLGIARWTHVCHDVGGLWTWQLLHAQPERVEKLVILTPSPTKKGSSHP